MWSISLELRGLFSTIEEDITIASFKSIIHDLCKYLPIKYPFIKDVIFTGIVDIDFLIKPETISEKITRIAKFHRKPKIINQERIKAINFELLYPLLDKSSESRVIGVTNLRIHDGEKSFGGFWSSKKFGIVESIPYWKKVLEIIKKSKFN